MFKIATVRIVAEQALANDRMDMHKGCGCGVVSNNMALVAKPGWRFFQQMLDPACVCMVTKQASATSRRAMQKKC